MGSIGQGSGVGSVGQGSDGSGDHGVSSVSNDGGILADNSVEAGVGVSSVVYDAAAAVSLDEGVLTDHVVSDAGFVLALHVPAVRVVHSIGEAAVVSAMDSAALSYCDQQSENCDLEINVKSYC